MKRILYVILLTVLIFIVGCNNQSSSQLDETLLKVNNVTLEEKGLTISSTIGDNNTNNNYIYGLKISLDNEEAFFELDQSTKTIKSNEYQLIFNIRDIPGVYYGSNLTLIPYIKNGDNIYYGSKDYKVNIIDKAKEALNKNLKYEYLDYITEYIDEHYKKVYINNNIIYIDNALYEYDQTKLGQEFLKDWNTKFNTNYNSFVNFASDNKGENNYYGSEEEVKNHKLYKFFNDDLEMIDKYNWIFDIIKSLNVNLNYISNQINIVLNENQNNKYTAYYGFYHILAQMEAFFTKTQLIDKNIGYTTFDYSDETTYYAVIRYFNDSNIINYAIGDYQYFNIGDFYEINTEIIECIGKEWIGFGYKANTYNNGDLFEITNDNVYLQSKYEYIPYTITFYDGDKELVNLSRVYNMETKDITLLQTSKYGYNFVGWYTSNTFEEDTKVEVIQKGTTGDIKLYAKFDPKPYSNVNIAYNLNGGEFNNGESNQTQLQEPINLPIPTRSGCKFIGWLCNIDNKVYTSYPGYYDFNQSIIYTATWEVVDMTDKERVEGTYSELIAYFEENKNLNNNLELKTNNEFYKTNIKFNSSNQNILTNDGLFTKPYIPEKLTLEFTISLNSESKTSTFEFTIEGFKELTNIASSYVYGGYDRLTDEFFETMDIIFCAFVLIDVNGGFTGLDGYDNSVSNTNRTYLNYMKTYVIPKAHQNGVRVVASIGGGGSSVDLAYEEIVKSDEKMQTLANNIVNLINEYGFDGADIDWEIPDNAKTFSKLSEKIYTAVKANNPNHIVTAAIGGGKWQPPKYDLTVSKNYLDYVNLMTYNMVGNGGYHHTSLYKSSKLFDSENKVGHTLQTCSIEESVNIYKNDYGINPNQIIIGAAFYGMKQKRTYTNGTYGSWQSDGTLSYTKIKNEYLSSSNYEYYYDTVCEAPYLLSKDKTVFISYDDPRSIKAKCEYIKNIKAAGIMYWQNGQDTTGDLVKAIKEGLNK